MCKLNKKAQFVLQTADCTRVYESQQIRNVKFVFFWNSNFDC